MDLERTMVAIRPRTPWEAVDLGFRMVRERWRQVYGSWALAAAPFWVATLLALHRWPWAAFLVLWWLKPLFDRAPLFVLSRAVFGADPTTPEVVRALPGLLKGHLGQSLLVHRLDRARSFHLPIWQLEGLRGTRRRQRSEVLDRQGLDVARLLTVSCLVMEICLLYGFFGLLAMVLPLHGFDDITGFAMGALDGTGPAAVALLGLALFVAHGLVEPCYVAAGFSLYLSRRTQLEGWDVELGFRRLARRLAGRLGAVVLGLLLLSGAAVAQRPMEAAETSQAELAGLDLVEADLVEADGAIREVLEDPEFDRRRTVTTWHLREWVRSLPFPAFRGPSWSFDLGGILLVVEVMVGVLLVLWLVWKAVRFLPTVLRASPLRAEAAALPVEATVGHGQRVEPLPADIPGTAWTLWQEGRTVEALGLLYRGAVARMADRARVTVHESWTEEDCVEQAREHLPAEGAEYFRSLTRAWVAAAYAHRPPESMGARGLFESWSHHFGGRP